MVTRFTNKIFTNIKITFRLCEDFIAEHLGHSNFLEVREIDFPNLSIRVIDLGNGARFKHLRRYVLQFGGSLPTT